MSLRFVPSVIQSRHQQLQSLLSLRLYSTPATTSAAPDSSAMNSTAFPILTTVQQVREWRAQRLKEGETEIGFVPTMGALHEGHLALVRSSLASNDSTIVSIFVNPAQFAPSEDLSTYPRTLDADLALLSSLCVDIIPSSASASSSNKKRVAALFLPPIEALYPGGITTDVSKQRGTFIEVKGVQDEMEGRSRPGFFRGVATVVLKLFNIVQPTRAYFGQKDIQQALLLRRLASDLHLTHPASASLIIHPTYRDEVTGLALSSRNAYLTAAERRFANVLVDALRTAQDMWKNQSASHPEGMVDVEDVLHAARLQVKRVAEKAKEEGVEIELLYILLNEPKELCELRGKVGRETEAVLSGAVRLGKTRLIDNLILGFELN